MSLVCRAAGAVSYETVTREGLKRDVLFCYDLKLPADFQPMAQVGELVARRHGWQALQWPILCAAHPMLQITVTTPTRSVAAL